MFERKIETARIHRNGLVSRRSFLKTMGLGAAGLSLGWHERLLAESATLRKLGKSVIVLWMQGGPSQFETFDPKSGSEGNQTGTIATAVPGVQIADFWPKVAKQMNDIAIVRSMTNKEGNHQRATYQLHTGYVPSGTLKHPSFGSLVASEIAPKDFDLPAFVSVLGPSSSSGFLPVSYSPFRVTDPTKLPQNTESFVPNDRFDRRLDLLNSLETSYSTAGANQHVKDHQTLYQQAARLVKSPKLSAFDLTKEDEKIRAMYGSSAFGKGCLLARRLVETGVTYVEVQLGNWDTHDNGKDRIGALAGQCDSAFAGLVADLKARGLLETTLVVWMGEFGRTPKVNPRGGRDHYPRAFNVAAAGCGIKGGNVIGKTSANGSDVANRPVTPNDLFSTFCHQLGIDPTKENQSPVGRPLKIVDGGSVVKELIS